ncbi:hypothetical protein QE393_000865 [Pseudomonas sp. SORGH_AS 211]|uniref:DUF1090 domain-containing protein n=1 Tax=Pseudomonas sp. SORGH_AS_0211 TaxID=3041796 RepID=UPI00285C974A|nr:DUF1090 domain-containing protein [Pseudomonas sp. SORGH_AS_0211]MDR6177605.1 hypothetical protein [Pseudomonas sp. SORGH_AS_0211]
MKDRTRAVLFAATLLLPGLAVAADGGCAAKRLTLERQIAQAQAQGDAGRLAGLRRALGAVQAHCTDAGLRQQRLDVIQARSRDVAERERDLRSAQAKGDADKIRVRTRKLAEARRELEEARARASR